MNTKLGLRRHTLLFVLILVIACPGWLAGCSGTPAGTGSDAATAATGSETATTTTAAVTETSATTLADSRPEAASGVLRLWWSKRQNLNPLLDSSQSGLAISKLIYQGLYAIDASQQIQPQLAGSLTRSEDGLQIQVQLQPNLAFHDGQQLQAGDVVACLNFIKAHAAESAYAAALGGIVSAAAVDELTIQLTLSQPDIWIAWALTFPVIPAARLNAGAFALVQGTGPFQMQSYSTDGLILARYQPTGAASELTTIRVIEFATFAAAMQAFEADGLDLVNLPPEEYSQYMLRNSLRFEQYIGNQTLFLAYNTQVRRLLADKSRLLYLKQLLEPGRLSLDGAGDWGECTAIPLPATSWLLGGQQTSQVPALESIGQKTWEATTRELVILLSDSSSIYQKMAAVVGSRLTAAGIAWRLEILPETSYLAALAQGQYDLTLMEAVMPEAPDATWLYRDDRPVSYSLLNTLGSVGLAEYDIWRQRLLQISQTGNASLDGLSCLNILNETAARSPWSVLLIRSAAVLYGDRVIGQCQPDRYNPYRGIEELWIWSGH